MIPINAGTVNDHDGVLNAGPVKGRNDAAPNTEHVSKHAAYITGGIPAIHAAYITGRISGAAPPVRGSWYRAAGPGIHAGRANGPPVLRNKSGMFSGPGAGPGAVLILSIIF